MKLYVIVMLGKDNKYLGIKTFYNDDDVTRFAETHQSLMLANIEGILSLARRIQLAPEYFHYAGLLEDYREIEIDLDI